MRIRHCKHEHLCAFIFFGRKSNCMMIKCIVCILCISVCVLASSPYQSTEFASVQSLLFRKGAMTIGRRHAPMNQLNCRDSECNFEPDVIACKNVGLNDKGAPTWACEAEVPSGYRLGRTDVTCEGFDRPGDPNILVGSCALIYQLHGKSATRTNSEQSPHSPSSEFIDLIGVILGATIAIFLIVVMIGVCLTPPSAHTSVHHVSSHAHTPPPAYNPAYSGIGAPITHHHSGGSGPGFWSGYWLGSSSCNRTTRYQPAHSAPPPASYTWDSGSSSKSTTSTGYGDSHSR